MRITITFEVEVPNGVLFTDHQLDEWIRWSFRDSGEISKSNPLEKEDPEPSPVVGSFDYTLALNSSIVDGLK